MKRAVIYARYSCDKQTDNSTKAQIRECEEWAKKNNIAIIDKYLDEAISGRTDRRPGFQRMINDAKLKLFDCVIVWKGDRFSRSRADAAKYKTMLKRLGIRVLSATEANLEGPEAVLMDGINESFAEYYSVELAAKVTRGMQQNFLDGKFNGGKPAWGYRHNKETGKMEIVPEIAEAVKMVFEDYVYSGMNPHQIRSKLISMGYEMKSREGVLKIIKNPKYMGVWINQNGAINVTAYPAIVSEELFRQAQDKLQENNSHGKRHQKEREKYYLLGKAFCGDCKAQLVAKAGTGKLGVVYKYYGCPNAKQPDHGFHNIAKDVLEDAVFKTVLNVLHDKNRVLDMIDEIQRQVSEEDPEVMRLQNRYRELEKKVANYSAAIAAGINLDSILQDCLACQNEMQELKVNLARAEKSHQKVSREDLEIFFTKLQSLSVDDPASKMALINLFVHSVFVYDEKEIDVILNFRGANGLFLKKGGVQQSCTMVHHGVLLANRNGGYKAA